jgi:AraC-like DNA-binding protein
MIEGQPPIGLRYRVPSQALGHLVSSYYVFHANVPYVADLVRAELSQIRLMISGSAVYHLGDQSIPAPEAVLIGPTFQPTRFEASGPLLVFGIGLLPAGWAALVREDASVYSDRLEDASPLFPRLIPDMVDAMRMAMRPERMFDIADVVLQMIFSRAQVPPLWFTALTDNWLASSHSPQVDDLIGAADLSGRQVERLARRIYGAPPKLLARKYRALKAATLLLDAADWRGIVGDAFYDQSHFIREIKQFTGLTPTQLLKQVSSINALMRRQRKLVSELPKLLSMA